MRKKQKNDYKFPQNLPKVNRSIMSYAFRLSLIKFTSASEERQEAILSFYKSPIMSSLNQFDFSTQFFFATTVFFSL